MIGLETIDNNILALLVHNRLLGLLVFLVGFHKAVCWEWTIIIFSIMLMMLII